MITHCEIKQQSSWVFNKRIFIELEQIIIVEGEAVWISQVLPLPDTATRQNKRFAYEIYKGMYWCENGMNTGT